MKDKRSPEKHAITTTLQSPWNIFHFRLSRRCLNLKPSACQRRSHSLFKSSSSPPPFSTLFNFWHARIEGCNLENDSGPGLDSHLGRWSTGQSEIFFSCSFRANWRRWHPVCIVETRVMKKKNGRTLAFLSEKKE